MLLTIQRRRGAAFALALALPLALPLSSHAAGDLMFLKNSPATKFDETDFKLLSESIDQALSGPVDGPEQTWKNDKSGASGSVVPQPNHDSAGTQECRRLKIANAYKAMKDEGVYTFCRASGKANWQLRP